MKKILAVIAFLVLTANVFGNERGNGGVTIICKDNQGKITQMRLMDLYVWEILEGLQFPEQQEEVTTIERSIERLRAIKSTNFLSFMEYYIQHVSSNWTLLPTGATVIPANDAPMVLNLPSGCSPVYTVNYMSINNRPKILVNRDIVQHSLFTSFQQGALKVHEAVYAVVRRIWADINSLRAQEITALLLAETLSNDQIARLKELTAWEDFSARYLKGVKVTALKSFTLESRRRSRLGTFSSTTRLNSNGTVSEIGWGNWPDGLWYYASNANDSVYNIKEGDVFIINQDGFPGDFTLKRISDKSEVSLGLKGKVPGLYDINALGLFKAEIFMTCPMLGSCL